MGSVIEINNLDEIVLYDGVCKFCNSSVNFLLRHEKNSLLKFSTLQSTLSIKLSQIYAFDTSGLNTLKFIKNGKVYSKSRAIFYLAEYLRFPWNIISVFKFFSVIITDFFYDLIAKNRYLIFGKLDSCILPDSKNRNRFLD